MKNKIIAVVSGGMDSCTMVKSYLDQGYQVDAVSFNYGQRHKKELVLCGDLMKEWGVRHDIVDLQVLTPLLAESGSSLVSDTEVPEGHYAEDNMRATIVPNRNMMMLSIAGAIAVARGADTVATGVHAGDHAVYPDCRPMFISAASQALTVGNSEPIGIDAPFVYQSKAQIARQAILLKLPFEKTWSCYKGGEIHCGKCGTCVERLEAVHEAIDQLMIEGNPIVMVDEGFIRMPDEAIDRTKYEDREFWIQAVEAAK